MRFSVSCFAFLLLLPVSALAEPQARFGLSLIGEPKYEAGLKHLDYVNPDAPKGGRMRLAATGTFDSLNPFIIKGRPAAGISLIYDTLMVSTDDEPSSEYGLIAQSVVLADDFSWVRFNMRPQARFHDGAPITPEDVIFSFETLRDQGQPFYRHYYANVVSAEKTGPHAVTFRFNQAGNRELPQIMGQLAVLPKHYYADRAFDETTLQPPLGSGPYRVKELVAGRTVVYERVNDWWGKDLPIMKGRNNLDVLAYEYYRDDAVALEAFKAGEFDLRVENTAKNWALAYDGAALDKGHIVKKIIPVRRAQPMQGFVFNTRRSVFADRVVRRAIGLAFDFETANKALFYGQYKRTLSFFEGSELAATGLPQADELALLEPFRSQLPEEVFTTAYTLPVSDGQGFARAPLIEAQSMLREAGWIIKDGMRVNQSTGQPLRFELLLYSPAFLRVAARYKVALKRLGIEMRVKLVDVSQYQNSVDNFDFDMIIGGWAQSLSPGNEQRNFWHSEAATRPGSRNFAGISDPVVDALIDKIIFAENRAALVAATRALDRVLLWGHYVVPQWHSPGLRVAYWNRYSHPEPLPEYSPGLPEIWWFDAAKNAALPDSGSAQ